MTATKILVVDDEPDLEYLINARFKKSISEGEFEFYYALNGVEALKILDVVPDIHIILTDINMPIMDGLTLLQNLALLKRNYKAVVVSAYGDISNIRLAMNRGASDFIMKPINFDDFKTTLLKMRDEYERMSASSAAESHLNELKIELEIARDIQESLLPSDINPFHNKFDIAGKRLSAKQVGGDFFDFFCVGQNKLAIVMADVSGKNVSACLYMTIAHSLIRVFSDEHLSPLEVIKKVDHYLSVDNNKCMFVTAFYAIWDLETCKIRCCNAGHIRPYIISNSGVQQISINSGRPLGLAKEIEASKEAVFEEIELDITDKTLFLFTDGVSEAMNIKDEEYGIKRLNNVLERHVKKTCPEIVANVLTDVQLYTAGTVQNDDITMLAIRAFIPVPD